MSSTTKVFITGATGFVGKWMQRTCPQGVEFYGVGHKAYENDAMEWIDGITHIVHLAPIAPYKMIKLAKRYDARLLYCSSGIVYHGEIRTKYRMDKLRWERDCLDEWYDTIVTRLFTFFGDGLDDGKAITQFKAQARAGEALTVARQEVTRTYMHGAEMGRQMWRALLKGESGMAYDIGSRRPVTVRRIAERIAAFTGCEIKTIDMRVPMSYYVPRGNYVPD